MMVIKDRRKYRVNDNFFKVWSHDMAYILGFWWADGWIGKDDGRFGVCQSKKDLYILEDISRIMESTYPVEMHKTRNIAQIRIRSKEIIDDIMNLGGEYNKSLSCKFPNIPIKYLPDFVRGLWDGDGCIYYHKSDKAYNSVFASGSLKFINELSNILIKNIENFSPNLRILEKRSKKGSIICGRKLLKDSLTYRISFGVNDTRRLRDFIYHEGFNLNLKRKTEKFNLIGEFNMCERDKIRLNYFLPYSQAREIISKMKIKNINHWWELRRDNKIPKSIPSCPFKVYRNNGWINWYDWLGKNKIGYMKFSNAIVIARLFSKDKIRTSSEWIKCDNIPNEIPRYPNIVYKNSGWNGWKYWLGIEFIDFDMSRKIARELKIKSVSDWNKYCKSENKNKNMPSRPDLYYRGKGWTSWVNFLGLSDIKWLSYAEAKTLAKENNITSINKWTNYCKSVRKRIIVPTRPYEVYKNNGWISWNDFLEK